MRAPRSSLLLLLATACFGPGATATRPPPVVDVRWFGAVGDGAADDWPAFEAAARTIGAWGGGTLHVPGGTFALSKAIPLVNGLRIRGEGYATRLLATGMHGIIGEAYPSAFVAAGWYTAVRGYPEAFDSQYDEEIARYQSGTTGVGDVVVENLVLDGNSANVPFNTLGPGGATDDAYQNAIRLDMVHDSQFRHLWIENAVMNGISNYNESNDNVFEDIHITNTGKDGPLPAIYSFNGIFVEAGSHRSRFSNIVVQGARQYGILAKALVGTQSDTVFTGVTVKDAALDGVLIGNDAAAATGSVLRSVLRQIRVVGCGGSGGFAGVRVVNNGSGAVDDTVLTDVGVTGGGDAGGVVVQGNVRRTIVSNAAVTGVSGHGFRLLNGALQTTLRGATATGNARGDLQDLGSSSMTEVNGTVRAAVAAAVSAKPAALAADLTASNDAHAFGAASRVVGPTASTIYTLANAAASARVIVASDDGTSGWMDHVLIGRSGPPTVVWTQTWRGVPPARIYSVDGTTALQLSLSAGSGAVQVMALEYAP